jgi:hypothetical protein
MRARLVCFAVAVAVVTVLPAWVVLLVAAGLLAVMVLVDVAGELVDLVADRRASRERRGSRE